MSAARSPYLRLTAGEDYHEVSQEEFRSILATAKDPECLRAIALELFDGVCRQHADFNDYRSSVSRAMSVYQSAVDQESGVPTIRLQLDPGRRVITVTDAAGNVTRTATVESAKRFPG